MNDNIQVAIRVRPPCDSELVEGVPVHWKIEGNTIYQADQNGGKPNQKFVFDHIFDDQKTNEHIYKAVVQPLVQLGMKGYNWTVFACGETSSGKSYTMLGEEDDFGIIPLTIKDIFEIIDNQSERDYMVWFSFIEIYNEEIIDLLDYKNYNKKSIKISEHKSGVVKLDVIKECIESFDEAWDILEASKLVQYFEGTKANRGRRKSHVIFQVIIESVHRNDDDIVQVSRINLVDLAASEHVLQTKSTGARLKKIGYFNKSLHHLEVVIQKLSEGAPFVDFRHSKLTTILKDSLGGNTKTLIIGNISARSLESSRSTLTFTHRATKIKNKPTVNEVNFSESQMNVYMEIVAKQAEIEKVQQMQATHGLCSQQERQVENKHPSTICAMSESSKILKGHSRNTDFLLPPMPKPNESASKNNNEISCKPRSQEQENKSSPAHIEDQPDGETKEESILKAMQNIELKDKEEVHALKDELSKTKEQNAKLMNELREAEKENLKSKKMRAKIDHLFSNLEREKNINKKLTQKIKDLELPEQTSKDSGIATVNLKASSKYITEDFKLKIKNLMKDKETLEQKLSNKEEIIKNLNQTHKTHVLEVKNLTKENMRLKADASDYKEKNLKLTLDLSKLVTRFNAQIQENKILNNQNISLEEKLAEQNHIIKIKQKESEPENIKLLEKNLRSIENAIVEYKTESTELHNKIDTQTKDAEKLKNQIHLLQENLKMYVNSHENLQEERDAFKEKLNQQQMLHTELTQKNDSLQIDVRRLKEEISDLNEEIGKYPSEIIRIENHNVKLDEQLSAAEDVLKKQTCENTDLLNKNDTLKDKQNELNLLNSKLQSENVGLKIEVSKYKGETEELNKKLKALLSLPLQDQNLKAKIIIGKENYSPLSNPQETIDSRKTKENFSVVDCAKRNVFYLQANKENNMELMSELFIFIRQMNLLEICIKNFKSTYQSNECYTTTEEKFNIDNINWILPIHLNELRNIIQAKNRAVIEIDKEIINVIHDVKQLEKLVKDQCQQISKLNDQQEHNKKADEATADAKNGKSTSQDLSENLRTMLLSCSRCEDSDLMKCNKELILENRNKCKEIAELEYDIRNLRFNLMGVSKEKSELQKKHSKLMHEYQKTKEIAVMRRAALKQITNINEVQKTKTQGADQMNLLRYNENHMDQDPSDVNLINYVNTLMKMTGQFDFLNDGFKMIYENYLKTDSNCDSYCASSHTRQLQFYNSVLQKIIKLFEDVIKAKDDKLECLDSEIVELIEHTCDLEEIIATQDQQISVLKTHQADETKNTNMTEDSSRKLEEKQYLCKSCKMTDSIILNQALRRNLKRGSIKTTELQNEFRDLHCDILLETNSKQKLEESYKTLLINYKQVKIARIQKLEFQEQKTDRER